MSNSAHRDAFDREREVNHFPCHKRGCLHPLYVQAEEYSSNELVEMANADCRFLDPVTRELMPPGQFLSDREREELRKRIDEYENEIRGDQLERVPSQIGIVLPVPLESGGYSDADIDLIAQFERETGSLAKAMNRFNLLPKGN